MQVTDYEELHSRRVSRRNNGSQWLYVFIFVVGWVAIWTRTEDTATTKSKLRSEQGKKKGILTLADDEPRPPLSKPVRSSPIVSTTATTSATASTAQLWTNPPSAELSRNATQESIRAILQDNGATDGSEYTGTRPAVVEIQVLPGRLPCQMGTCLYRAYLEGPAKMGSYLHFDDQNNEAKVYKNSFELFEAGSYRLLVLLESLKNSSETNETANLIGTVVCGSRAEGICMAERVSNTYAEVHIDIPSKDIPPYQHNPQAYQEQLPLCRFGTHEVYHNQYEWVPRATLESRSFSPEHTTIVPSTSMPPFDKQGRSEDDIKMFLTKYPDWIQPYQDCVWHPRNCRQPWISATSFAELAAQHQEQQSEGGQGTKLVFFGTSRIRHTHALMHNFLQSEGVTNVETDFIDLQVTSNFIHRLKKTLKATNTYCPRRKPKNAPMLYLIVTHGTWEATYYRDPAPFRFMDIAQATINFLMEHCQDYKYQILIMTSPATHVFDGRIEDVYTEEQKILDKDNHWVRKNNTMPLRNARINVANYAWKELAEKYQFPLLDFETMSFSRYDTVTDDVHYVYPYTPKEIEIGNEVTMTFVQTILSAIVQTFTEKEKKTKSVDP